MRDLFDDETLDRLRRLTPQQAYDTVRAAVFRLGAVSSAELADAFAALVAAGVLTWDDIERFEGGRRD
jgi:hypothetical protein